MQANFSSNDHDYNCNYIVSDSNCNNDFDCLLAWMADRKLAEWKNRFAWLKHAACNSIASFDNHTCDTAKRWEKQKSIYAVER